jgi:hypothetical protein
MSKELDHFKANIEDLFFGYAHITGAVEIYILALENKNLQSAFSKSLFNSNQEWKTVHRFMIIDEVNIKWYPDLPTETIAKQKHSLFGFLYGTYLGKMIASIDFYFSSVLYSKTGQSSKSGSSWGDFSKNMKIDLLQCENGKDIFLWLQERHKIEHNNGKIDEIFVDKMLKKCVTHSYLSGDTIQKSHLDVLAAYNAIINFVIDVDKKVNV